MRTLIILGIGIAIGMTFGILLGLFSDRNVNQNRTYENK